MQILPTQHTTSGRFDAAIAQTIAQFAESFATSLEEAESELMDTTQETDAEKERAQKAQGIYTKHTTDGFTYTLDECCFTQKELGELYSGLLEKGAPAGALSGLKKLTELPDGANLGQVLASLKGKNSANALSDEDANDITSLMNSLDPSGVLGSQVLDSLYNNDPMKALRQVFSAIENMDAGDTLSLNKNDLLAFGRGLGLSQKSLESLVAPFGDAESGEIAAGNLKKLLAPASEEVLSAQSDHQKLEQALNQTLTPMLNKAHARMEREAQAMGLKNRESALSQVMIDRTVQEQSRNLLNTILDDAQDGMQEATKGMPRSQLDVLRMEPMTNQDSFDGTMQQNFAKQSFEQMLHQAEVTPTHRNTSSFEAMNFALASFAPNMAQLENATSLNTVGQNLPTAQHILQQVEEGLFMAFKDGTSKLDIQLHPQELGTVAVTLISRNGEVSALLRCDSPEATEALQQQAEQIKQTLEEQGIRVDKVQVELREQEARDASDYLDWQGNGQETSYHEEEARRERLRRLRRLSVLNNDSLERHMHTKSETENSANRVLDKVA